MQNIHFKKFQLFFIVLIITAFHVKGQVDSERLAVADSLFQAKKYTESFEIYEALFEQNKKVSSAMLLKMAYIKEGLGDYTHALYYLYIYFNHTLDASVLKKINELSSDNELIGYDSPETIFIQSSVKKYSGTLKAVLIILLGVWLLATILMSRKEKKIPMVSVILLLVFSIVFLITNNITSKQYGIITQNSTYLLEGPAASSNVKGIIGKGHKVQILDESDIWSKVTWEGEEVFIRKSKIKKLI